MGTGLVALLTVLGIVPRLMQITRTKRYIHLYQSGIVGGTVFWSWIALNYYVIQFPSWITAIWGLFAGLFVGMLAAALTEVLNVLPILAKRLQMAEKMVWFLMAMVLGKVLGSLFHWLLFYPINQ